MRWVYGLVLTVGMVVLCSLDGWARNLTDNNVAAREFILSSAFWPTLFGCIAAAIAVMGTLFLLAAFIPSRSGRPATECGE